jgi:hypothetical protein
MTAKITRLTHKITIQLHLVTESCTIYSSRSRWPVRKFLDTPSYEASVEKKYAVRISEGKTQHLVSIFT